MTDEQFDNLCAKLDKLSLDLIEMQKILLAGLLTNAGLNKAALGTSEVVSTEELEKAFKDGNIIFNNYYNSIKKVEKP